MTNRIKFGILTMQHLPWQDEIARWKQLDALGFDSIWLADHFVNFMDVQSPWFESWTLLAALATVTQQARIGVAVTSMPLRHPAVLAKQVIVVDHISNGRLELGLGCGASGETDPVYKMIGIKDLAPPERVAQFREYVEVIDCCLKDSKSSFKGKYFNTDDVVIEPRPVQKPRPPLMIGAMGKSMIRIAAKYADSWNSFGDYQFMAPVDIIIENTKRRVSQFNKYCKEFGRNPDDITKSLLVYGEDAQTAFATEDHFKELVRRYTSIGINELILYYPIFAPEQIPVMEQIARDVIPELR